MAKLLKWQQEFDFWLSRCTNVELWGAYHEYIRPDDYDGCFTSRGEWRMLRVSQELERRLKVAQFLP